MNAHGAEAIRKAEMAQLRSESFSVSAEFLSHQIILEAIPTTIARRQRCDLDVARRQRCDLEAAPHRTARRPSAGLRANPEQLADRGIAVHIIKRYGDTAVAESAVALMWASAKGIARMDRGMRAGHWLPIEGVQLTGKTLGLLGFGGFAAETARLALGTGMKVIAWNRSPRIYPQIEFLSLE